MNYLFIHRRCPGPFEHIAATMGARPGNSVYFLAEHVRPDLPLHGVQSGVVLVPGIGAASGPMEREALMHLRRAESFALAMRNLRDNGFRPDVLCCEADGGAAHFAREIFPEAQRVCRCEWFEEALPEPEKTTPPTDAPDHNAPRPAPEQGAAQALEQAGAAKIRNQYRLCAVTDSDRAYAPTAWQRSRFPAELRDKIAVIPDAVDTVRFAPLMQPGLAPYPEEYPGLAGADEIITYACREFSSTRLFPEFCAALPLVLEHRPGCHVVIMGADAPCDLYDAPALQTWREAVGPAYAPGPGRVHFTGFCPRPVYARLLQASSLHVHTTRPHTLARSLLEALSCGCPVMVQDAPQVLEAVAPGEDALVFSGQSAEEPELLAGAILDALDHPGRLELLRKTARTRILAGRSLRIGLLPLLRLLARN